MTITPMLTNTRADSQLEGNSRLTSNCIFSVKTLQGSSMSLQTKIIRILTFRLLVSWLFQRNARGNFCNEVGTKGIRDERNDCVNSN